MRSIFTRSFSTRCRAAHVHSYKDDINIVDHHIIREPKPHEVVVKVHAASTNPIDYAMLHGYGKSAFEGFRKDVFPFVLGRDCSGTVSRVGSEVCHVKEGDEIVAATSPVHPDGAFAEYVTLPVSNLCHKPKLLTHIEAAAYPYAALTAWSAMFRFARIEAGQTVLIHGGSGSIGSIAIQKLKSMGCYVITTCSTHNVNKCRSLGADLVIDYTQEDFTTITPPCDVVIDAAGSYKANQRIDESKSIAVLKANGSFVTLNGDMIRLLDQNGVVIGLINTCSTLGQKKWQYMLSRNINYHWALFIASNQSLAQVFDLVTQQQLTLNVDRVFALDDTKQALDYMIHGPRRGKVVIDMLKSIS